MEFSTMCRVCMQTISLEYVDLDTPFNETTYFECFNYCTKLEAKASDKLPKTICLSCANLLQTAYDFIVAAIEADRLFQECIAQLNENYSEGDNNFVPEDEFVDKEIIMSPNLSIQNKLFVSDIKRTTSEELIDSGDIQKINHVELKECVESIEDQELQQDALQLIKSTDIKREPNLYRYILPKEEREEQNELEEIVDTRYTDLSTCTVVQTDAHIATELPVFEIVESIEVEKLESNVPPPTTSNTQKDLKPAYRYILPKDETEEKTSKEQEAITKFLLIEKDFDLDLIEQKDDPIRSGIEPFETEDTFPFSANQESDTVLAANHDSKPKIKYRTCKKNIRKNSEHHVNRNSGNRSYNCDKCDESFLTLKQYKVHKSQNHKKFRNIWFCHKCGESFDSEANLNTHQENDHDTTSSLCLTCGYILTDQNALEQHVKNTHWTRRRPVECTHCNKKYQLNTLPMHVQYAHLDVIRASENEEFVCKYCFGVYEGPSDLEKHIQTHKGIYLYSCSTCMKDCKSKEALEDHQDRMHPVQNIDPNTKKCNRCDFTTSDLSSLIKHRKKHYKTDFEKTPKFLCAYCPKKFFYLKPLNDHEDYQHGEQKTAHQCDLCGKKFYSNFKLKTHKKSTHGNERPFMCKECPKAFKLRPQLLQHEKNHYGRKIDCPHCDKKFVQPCYLRIHLRTHTNELPYECHLCDKKFAIKVRLTYHLAKHEGIVRKCEYCPETFDNMAKLRIHRFEHTGYPFVCELCKENHHKRESFVRHMKRHHEIIMTEADVEENRLRNMRNFYRNNKVQAESDLEI